MVAPTISSISPGDGHPSGGYLIRINGANFELQPEPPESGYVGNDAQPTVEVEINGQQCSSVRVFSSEFLTCLVPRYSGEPSLLSVSPGLDVNVVIRNLTGLEETEYVDYFTYKRKDLTRSSGCLAHIVRSLILDMRRQIIDNIAINTHIDYDSSTDDSLDVVELAKVPGIALFGPTIIKSVSYQSIARELSSDIVALEYIKYDDHHVADIRFSATIVCNTINESMNLLNEFLSFFRNNRKLVVQKNTSDIDDGYVEYDMFLIGGVAGGQGMEREAEFEIRGVPIDDDDWKTIEWGTILDDPPDVDIGTEHRS